MIIFSTIQHNNEVVVDKWELYYLMKVMTCQGGVAPPLKAAGAACTNSSLSFDS